MYDIQSVGFKNAIFNTSKIDVQAIVKYNSEIAKGTEFQQALAIASRNTNKETVSLMTSAQGAVISTEELTAAQKASTVAAKAQSAAYMAVSIAANMIVTALAIKGIQLASDAIDHYVNRAKYAADAMEEAQQKIDDAQSTLQDMSSTISENKDRFLELSKGVDEFSNNLSLSEEDYKEYLSISNKLADLSPSLVSGYDDQGNALLNIGDSAEETSKKLDNVLKKQKAIAEQILIDNMDDVANGIYYEVKNTKQSISDLESELSTIQQQYKNVNVDIINSDGLINFNDEDFSKYGKALEDALNRAGIEFKELYGMYDTSVQLITASPAQLSKAQTFYDTWLETENEYYHASENGLKQDIETKEKSIEDSYSKMTANLQAWVKDNYDYQYLSDDSSALVDKIIPEIDWSSLETPPETAYDYQNYVEENIIKPLMEIPSEHKQEINNMFNKLLSFEDGDLDVLSFAKQLQTKLNEYGITIDITPIIANEQEVKDKLQASIESISQGGSADFTTSSGKRVDAKDYKELQEYTKDFTDSQIELWNKVTLGTKNAKDAIIAYEDELKNVPNETPDLSLTETITELDKVKEKMDVVDKTYAKLFDKDENIGFEDYSNIAEAFKDVSGIENYIDKLQKAGQNTEEVKKIMSSLTGAYIEQSGILDKVNEQNAGLIEQTLTEMGVENSHELVLQRLSAAKEIAALKSFDLANATTTDILKLVEEGKVSEETANYLLQYALKKELANGTTLTTDSDIENIKKLVLALGGAIDELNAFQNAKNGVLRQLKNPNKTKKHTGNTKIFDEGSYSTESQEKAQDEIDSVLTKQYNYSGGSATSKAMDDAAKSAKKASDTAKETAQTLDWIETKLKLASKETEKLSKSFDKAFGMNQTRERYHAYISQIESEIQDNTTAAQVYQEKLNQIGLSYEWIAKIQSGAFSIDSITDENLKTQISEYQTYSDKLNSCYDTIESLEEERLQASVNYAEKLIDSHEKEIDSINKLIDRRKALVSLKETFGLSASKSDLKYQQDQYEQEIDALERQNKEIYDLMWTTTYGDEAWQKYNDQMIENTSSIQDLTQSLADLASEMANLPIDKYEKALDKISAKNDLLDAKLENATSDKAKSKIIGSQLKLTRKKDNSAQSAAKTTQSNLNQSVKDLRTATKKDNNISVYNVDALGPNVKARTAVNDYYKKVQNYTKAKKQIPASLISKISGDGYSTLSKACANYNAALVANDTAQETAALSRETIRQELADLAEQRASLAKTTADSKVEKYDSKDELYDAKLDNATSTSSKNKLIDRKISNINNRQSAYNTAVKTDNKNIKSAQKNISKIKSTKKNKKILASIKKAAKAGKRISQSLLNKAAKLNDGGKLYDACIQYNAYLDAKEADKVTADLYKETAKQDKATLAKEKFDNIASKYDNKISSNEQKKTEINNRISLVEEFGGQANVSDYKSLISAENGEYKKLIKEREELRRNLEESVVNGFIKKGSDEWYDMVAKINDVTNAIDESIRSIKQYQNALRQLKWDTFDKSLETVKRVNSEADYYIDLLSHKDMTDKDTGNFTEYGIATIGLHKTNYDNYIAQAEAYQSEYDKIMKQIEKGELSASDENVIQRLRDLQDAHREAKKSAEDELESINDLVKQGYEAQTDALSKLIEKYKKLKDSELEAYRYQKEIAEKTKQIASLQKQLTAYTGNNSEESRATIQKLKVELENAKSDLKDTQYEKFISDTEDMLDDLMSDYQEFIDEKINDTNTILDSIKELLGGNDGIIATLKSLDSSLTNTTKDQIDSSTTNGGDGGQGAKDYVNNTVTNDRNTINSSHKTGLLRPTAVGTITLDNSLESKKKNTTSIDDKLKNEKKAVKDAINSGKSRSKKLTDKENKEHADLWKYIVKNYGRTPTNKMYKKLGGILGVKTDDTVTSKQKTAILNRMKFNGYKKGSEHIDKSQLAWTQEDKREMIYRASDGAVLTKLNPGDKVFTNEMTENLWKLAKMNPAQIYAGQFMPVTPDFSKSVNNSSNIEVTFGDLVLPDVTNSAEFADSVESVMREAICKNGKTTQCITEAVSAKQLGKNGVGNARLYK